MCFRALIDLQSEAISFSNVCNLTLSNMKRCFDTDSVREAAEKTSRKYNHFLISWHDKTYQCADGDKLMENCVDKKKSELVQKEIIEILAR